MKEQLFKVRIVQMINNPIIFSVYISSLRTRIQSYYTDRQQSLRV